jgi:hypothetical protein
MSIEGTKEIGTKGTQQNQQTGGTSITADSSKGRLLRFLFCPPGLGPLPLRPGGFAARLARVPVDLVTRLGMTRSNAYYATGCPLELCDHAAARDLWRVIYRDAAAADGGDPKAVSEGEDLWG